jgi:tetratricopeptide (TPR) repeat protein
VEVAGSRDQRVRRRKMAKTDTWLRVGMEATKAGQKDKARRLLEQVVEADRTNETAWLWLSAVVDTREERIKCLEMALKLNPANQDAQMALEWLGSGVVSEPPPQVGIERVLCGRCGTVNTVEDNFCRQCGTPLRSREESLSEEERAKVRHLGKKWLDDIRSITGRMEEGE